MSYKTSLLYYAVDICSIISYVNFNPYSCAEGVINRLLCFLGESWAVLILKLNLH